jgi:ABC-type transporter Mla subunit MlaD
MSKTISEQVKKAEMLISGLRNNVEIMKNAGLNEMLISELETENSVLNKQNQELERLLEEARPISKDANQKLSEVRTKYQEIKKKVKLSTEPSRWERVGIVDKR